MKTPMIRLSGCMGRSESSVGTFRVVRIAKYLLAENEDSDDQTAWMHGQIRIFTGHILDSQGLLSILSRTMKTPMIRLSRCMGRSESSLGTFWIAKDC